MLADDLAEGAGELVVAFRGLLGLHLQGVDPVPEVGGPLLGRGQGRRGGRAGADPRGAEYERKDEAGADATVPSAGWTLAVAVEDAHEPNA
ncbi:MAG: hypothetical protein NVSMB13_02910 [Mycobacteriales bacterium]